MSAIADLDQRRQAVLTPAHAFVWASAGTGKTHTLTLRALWWLLSAPFHPRARDTQCARLYTAVHRAERLQAARAVARKFVLTTFTRKAAAEMQTRLYGYLDQLASASDLATLGAHVARSNGGHGDAQFIEIVERALDQVGDFTRLQTGAEALAELATELPISTLHSYAAAILRRHPIAAGIPSTARFVEEDDTTQIDPTGLVVERWWQHVITDDALNAQLQQLVEWFPLGDLATWLETIVRYPWLAAKLDLGEPDPFEVREVLAALEDLVAGLANARANAKTVIAARESLSAVLPAMARGESGAWETGCRVLGAVADLIYRKPSKRVTDTIANLGERSRYFGDFETIYLPLLRQCLATDWAARWRVWRAFVTAFADWADGAVVRELDLVTFDEMVRRAVRVLRDHPDARREERERLWGLLVDEFQDTDPTQLELLRLLLERGSARDHEVLGFFVGDRKQSIYRFRDADLPAIEKFVQDYPSRTHTKPAAVPDYQLTASFRSLPSLTSFVNRYFETAVPLPAYAQERLAPVRKAEGDRPVWWTLPAVAGSRKAEAQRLQAATATAQLILDYRQTTGGSYRDVVVLVNTHTELEALLPILEAAGIPLVSTGARTFYQKPEVLDMLSLLIAAHNPLDSLAVGALLRSPLVGLSDRQIDQLQQALPSREIFGSPRPLPTELPAPARTRLQQLRRLIEMRTASALNDWCAQVRGVVPEGVYASQDQEGRALVRIDSVLAAFQRVVRDGTRPALTWLLEQRARVNDVDRHDAAMGEDVTVTDESMDAVGVMTIHKAKGLQGRFVIIPGWDATLAKRETSRHRQACYQLTTPDGESLTEFALDLGALTIISPRYSEAAKTNNTLEQEEADRLAYVAATRARDRLALLSHAAPAPPDALAGVLTEITAPVPPVAAAASPSTGTVGDAAAYGRLWRDRLAAGDQALPALLHRPSQPETVAEADAQDTDDAVAGPAARARERALAAGTLGHRYLEQHLLDAQFDAAKLEALADGLGRDVTTQTRQCLEDFWDSPAHARARAARVLAREVPVFLTTDDRPWNGVIDLVLEEAGGIVGIDYKFMSAPATLPESYARQETLYRTALEGLFPGRTVRFEFWWLQP